MDRDDATLEGQIAIVKYTLWTITTIIEKAASILMFRI